MTDYRKEYEKWLQSPALSPAEHQELLDIAGDDKEIESRFFAPLSFGTAGLRGTMAVGLNRMNVHVIRHATQGFAQLILSENAADKGVVICYDCRINSALFAREAAMVMAANGIRVRLFDAMRPTPELSFAIREYGAIAGVNVTASHNPKAYKGYKVYWSDGAQLPPEHAAAVAASIDAIDIFSGIRTMDFAEAEKQGLITLIGAETDEKYLEQVLAQTVDRACVQRVADRMRLVYTPFHGTGRLLVPEALRRLGIRHLLCVEQQMIPDGSFPTVESPNPENPEGFYLAVNLAKNNDVDLIIGTDPDADRVGTMVRNKQGDYVTISGNQMGVLLLDYLICAKTRTTTMPPRPAALKTIVTTELARAVAEKAGVACFDTFTGFKFMAEQIKGFEADGSYNAIFSYEESYGYMIGTFVRDKDAVTASTLIAEMAAYYFEKGMTLLDALEDIFARFGHYGEKTLNLVMPGLDGLEKMAALMARLRKAPPQEIGGTAVSYFADYTDGKKQFADGRAETMPLSGSNVLEFGLADGTKLLVRPSGTEPKVKVYILARGTDAADCEDRIDRYTAFAISLQ